MKSLILPGILLAAITSSQGQGTVNFSSFATGVNAPVTNDLGGRITSPVYLADLYFSANADASTDQLTAAHFNVPFSTLTLSGGGYFLGGTRTVTNVPGGTVILAQVRVWDSSLAPTYEQATNFPGFYGYSQPPILIQLGQPPAPAPNLVGLQGFSLINGIEYAPIIDKQPQTQNAPVGATIYFGVHATNPVGLGDIAGPFYQWYFNLTNPLPGATKPVLELTNVQPAQAGSYHVVVRNLQGPKFSTVVNLGVLNTALPAPLVSVLSISNLIGSRNVLQYAPDVDPASSWLDLVNLTPTNSPQLYVDGSSTNVPSRIYRLVQVP